MLIDGLTNGVEYFFQIYADNGVNTDYNKYYFSATPKAAPITITNLSSYTASGQINLSWSLSSDVQTFYIVLYDYTLDALKVINLKPSDATLTVNNSVYNFVLNQYSAQLPALQSTDSIKVTLFSENSTGVSLQSNSIRIN